MAQTAPLYERILQGDVRALARAASLIENQTAAGRELLKTLFPHTGRAITLGITGPPGVGKSTLVSQLARLLRARGKTVAIVAVDPSSPFSRGAILGDRIRMQEHHGDPGVFIRSSATRGQLGGLAQTTLELALLFDAAGREVVLVETVGVGQDEIDVSRMADVTVLVLAPGLGDDVQAIKAGVMEIADIFAINKADLPGADRLEQEIRTMQSFAEPSQAVHAAPVRRVVATEGTGVEDLLQAALDVFARRGRAGAHAETWMQRLRELLRARLLAAVPEELIRAQASAVAARTTDPFTAIDALAALVLKQAGPEHGRPETTRQA